MINNNVTLNKCYLRTHSWVSCVCSLRPNIDRTSDVNLNASSIGRRFNRAVSDGSANHDLIAIALSESTKKNPAC